MRCWLDALDMSYALNLFVNKIDERGAVLQHPSAMKEAFRLGGELVSADKTVSEESVDVALF